MFFQLKEEYLTLQYEMKKLKIVSERKFENIYQVKLKKKIISDLLALPNVSSDVNEITKKIEECLARENTFIKKEKIVRKKENLAPNKAIVDQKSAVKDDKVRLQLSTENSSTAQTLNISLLPKKTKNKSFFSFCNKICMCFKKKKTYDEFEIQK